MKAMNLLKLAVAGRVCVLFLFGQGIAGSTSTSTGKARTTKKTKTAKSAAAADSTLPKPSDFVEVDVQPVPMSQPQPVYPDSAMKASIEGSVWVKVLIDREGKAKDAIILKESGRKVGFEESALAAAKQSTWKPATQKGKPVAVWVSYEVKFTLK